MVPIDKVKEIITKYDTLEKELSSGNIAPQLFAKKSKDASILSGGGYDDSKGYFIQPTTILTTDPHFKTMEKEIFGPVLTIYIYNPKNWDHVIDLVNSTSPYALTAYGRLNIEIANKKIDAGVANLMWVSLSMRIK